MCSGHVYFIGKTRDQSARTARRFWAVCLSQHLDLPPSAEQSWPAHQRRDFFVYVDEFQNFTTLAMQQLAVFHLMGRIPHQLRNK